MQKIRRQATLSAACGCTRRYEDRGHSEGARARAPSGRINLYLKGEQLHHHFIYGGHAAS